MGPKNSPELEGCLSCHTLDKLRGLQDIEIPGDPVHNIHIIIVNGMLL